MRRICCFCESWGSGGIESFLNNVLTHMDLSGMEVDIVAACIGESVFTPGLKARGVRLVELSGKLRCPQNCKLFRRLLRERKYDLIHFNLFQGLAFYYIQIAKEEGVAVRIAHSHGPGLRNSLTKCFKLLLHKAGRTFWGDSATEYWACSKPAADFLFAQRMYSFLPNGIDVKRFSFRHEIREKVRIELGLSEEILIGTVGRLSAEKNQGFLLSVFHKFHLECSNSKLLLVGDGEEKGALMKQAERLGISDCVIFYGPSQRVNELLCAMDVFVIPSIFEGLSFAAIEAQACGLPVLCSEGIPEEAKITPLVKMISLELGAQRWAEELLQWKPEIDRTKGAQYVNKAGFNISDVAFMISKKYWELNDGTSQNIGHYTGV